ncbi:hypothetical protein SteCoe_1676 [Stentor coeruleus]|uniref:Sugar phosphate transporter domain-containing protein n=1 Tax=Stentor coeruleus TaxID=5963 RepID=A0A1R2D147_9CILI|nr:hypothetical protein SteCoe_1676 [Stentor coeruleus]
MIGVLLKGTLSTIVSKAMNEQSSEGEKYHHPYLQAASMFVGESICYGLFRLYSFVSKSKNKVTPLSPSKNLENNVYSKLGNFIFFFPAFFHLIASTISFIGLVFIAPSIYQMMKGFIVVIVAISSVLFLKKKIYRHQVLGCVLITLGIIIVGIVSIIYKASSASNPILGAGLVLFAQLFMGAMLITEELFFRKITIEPFHAQGIEGICGLVSYMFLLPVLNALPCTQAFCNNGFVENSLFAFKQIYANTLLATIVFSMIGVVAMFNWTGIAITKYTSSLARSTLKTTNAVFVWVVSIFLGWENFLWQQLIGFLILVSGTLIYNEILIIPLWGFKQAAYKRKAEKEKVNLLMVSEMQVFRNSSAFWSAEDHSSFL